MILPPDEISFFAAACDAWPSGRPFWTDEAGELSDAVQVVNVRPASDPKTCDPFVRLAWVRWRKTGRPKFDAGDVGEAFGIVACMYVVAKGSRWIGADVNMVPGKVAALFRGLLPKVEPAVRVVRPVKTAGIVGPNAPVAGGRL